MRDPGSLCSPDLWLENSSEYLYLKKLEQHFKIITARNFFVYLEFLCCQLTRISWFAISRKEKKKLGASNLRLQFRHSISIIECPEAFISHQICFMSSENLPRIHIILAFCLKPNFPPGHTTFGTHTIIPCPPPLPSSPQIFTIYLCVLRCVLHYTRPVKCLFENTAGAKVKQVF